MKSRKICGFFRLLNFAATQFKMKGLTIMFLVMLTGILISGLWTSVPIIKETANAILNPTAGRLIDINPYFGMIIILLIITAITTIIQKYATNQEELKKLRAEQKLLQEEMKKYKDNPAKLMDLQKKQLEFIPKTMDLTMSSAIYTVVPMVLFFRWFSEYFTLHPFKFFGFLSWFWFYLLFSIFASSILRKIFKVV